MSFPLVTILIPTYNRVLYLRDAIRSAMAQTYSNIEILILDDASPDNTSEVVAEFAEEPRIRYIRHEANLGIAGNWRAGIQIKNGDFFCLLHDDDTFEPCCIEALLQPLLEDSEAILAFCDHWVMDEEGRRSAASSDECSQRFRRDKLTEGKVPNFAHAALVDASPPIGATLFRSNMISPDFIHEEAKGSIDAWLFYQCVSTKYNAYYIPQRLMNYRSHSGGMSSSMPVHMAEGHIYRYRKILADPELSALHNAIQHKLALALTEYSINQLVQGRYLEARHSAQEARRLSFNLRAQVIFFLTFAGSAGMHTAKNLKLFKRKATFLFPRFTSQAWARQTHKSRLETRSGSRR